mmetsp:Transcript_116575/g.238461  ORF Transcript_116575/g.238461 Transcript_116575/m.238461 type:complete len:84 (+) Transcript_116575:1263-1514(+)
MTHLSNAELPVGHAAATMAVTEVVFQRHHLRSKSELLQRTIQRNSSTSTIPYSPTYHSESRRFTGSSVTLDNSIKLAMKISRS